MPAHEVTREDWPGFFDELSRKRQGALVSVSEVDPSTEPVLEIKSLPLVGIAFDEKGSERNSIEIMAGTEPNDHVTHVIESPREVFHKTGRGILSSELNEEEIVEITASGHPPITYIRFLPGVIPAD